MFSITSSKVGVSAITLLAVLLGVAVAAAGDRRNGGKHPNRDVWGHTYKRQTNLFRDRDSNGVLNLYQQRDRQPKMIRSKSGRLGKQRR